MTSPRHLWSGDWRRDSEAAAGELAKLRALLGAPGERPEEPAEAPRPPRLLRERTVAPEPRPTREAHLAPRERRTPSHGRPAPHAPSVPPHAPSVPPRAPPRAPSIPPREPLLRRAAAAPRRGIEKLRRIPPPTARHRRVALLIALGALVVAGAAYGLAQIGGSGGSPASLLTTGRPWLGVELSQPPGGGVIVGNVAPGGPGDRAGIQPGDVIMTIGNQPVNSPSDVESAIENMHVGDQVSLTVLRGADSYTTLVRLAGRPAGTP